MKFNLRRENLKNLMLKSAAFLLAFYNLGINSYLQAKEGSPDYQVQLVDIKSETFDKIPQTDWAPLTLEGGVFKDTTDARRSWVLFLVSDESCFPAEDGTPLPLIVYYNKKISLSKLEHEDLITDGIRYYGLGLRKIDGCRPVIKNAVQKTIEIKLTDYFGFPNAEVDRVRLYALGSELELIAPHRPKRSLLTPPLVDNLILKVDKDF